MSAISSDIPIGRGPHKDLRIAVASPGAIPETFIQAHIDHLHKVVLVLSDGEKPGRIAGGAALMRSTPLGKAVDAAQAMLRGTDLSGEHSRRMASVLKQYRVQVLLAEYGNTAMTMIDACKRTGIPMVVHFHGIDAHGLEYHERYGNYRQLFESAAALVVVSRSMEQQLLQLGAPREKLFFNCYGVDPTLFVAGDPPRSAPHFVAVGRFVEKKAPHLTLLAFARVVAQRPQARLTMIGNGRLWEAVVQLRDALGLQQSVDLCGVKDPSWIAERMRSSRAFVQHSVTTVNGDSEGTPLAVLEAMAAGIPVIATRHAGIVDAIVNDEQGLLIDPFDIDAMTAAMVRLIDDPALAGRLGTQGRLRVVEHYVVRTQVGRLQALLEQVVPVQ